jgi:hypothetical protein
MRRDRQDDVKNGLGGVSVRSKVIEMLATEQYTDQGEYRAEVADAKCLDWTTLLA